MRVLLLSTYELGHQPLGIAVPAAALEAAGHETLGVDLAICELPREALAWADRIAVSIPMHTATQLAIEVIAAARAERPGIPVAWHGLYATVLEGRSVVHPGDLLAAGEIVPALLAWLEATDPPGAAPGAVVDIGPARRPVTPAGALAPLRRDLPPISRYAKLLHGGREVPAAMVVATTGCNHTCRHCPVAPIYRGRSRPVDPGAVLTDIDAVVKAGAGHVTFGDPDFLNRPAHSLTIVSEMHRRHPGVTFDATVKVEHILRHPDAWTELAGLGLLFVVSAFESVDDTVLGILDKGHTAAGAADALAMVRAAGIELRPSWMPFTPWTTSESFAALLRFVAEEDLVWSIDPVQYSIRLLLPSGSLLLEEPDAVLAAAVARAAAGRDPSAEKAAGDAPWAAPDPALDALQAAVAARAELAALGESPDETFATIWDLARAAGASLPAEPPPPRTGEWIPGAERPRLSESWFCCAEPTSAQLVRIRA